MKEIHRETFNLLTTGIETNYLDLFSNAAESELSAFVFSASVAEIVWATASQVTSVSAVPSPLSVTSDRASVSAAASRAL